MKGNLGKPYQLFGGNENNNLNLNMERIPWFLNC